MADPIHQFQIVNYFSLGKIGSVKPGLHEFRPLHGRRRGSIRCLMLGAPLDASSYPDECSQWPSSPTSSSPTPYATR